MNHICRNLFLLLSSVSVLSCGSGTDDPVLAAYTKGITEISPVSTINIEDMGVFSPYEIHKYDNCFVFQQYFMDHFVDIYNTDTGDVIRCAYKGRGFGEVLNASIQVLGGFIYLYDSQTNNYWRIDIEKTIADGRQSIEKIATLSKTSTPNTYYDVNSIYKTNKGNVCLGFLGERRWYSLMDDAFEEKSYVEDCDFDNFRDLSTLARNNVFCSSYISVSPDESRLVCAAMSVGSISISEINGDNLNEYFRRTFYSCEVRDTPNGPAFNDRLNRKAFSAVCSDANNIYLLYSGHIIRHEDNDKRPWESSYLIVLDWNGKYKRSYHLTDQISVMCLEGNRLYGISRFPVSKIVEYSLPE